MIDARHYRLGEVGSHIRDFQRCLTDLGYSIPMNGIFNHETQAAIENLEEDFGFQEFSKSFCIDPQTLKFILNRGRKKPSFLLPMGKGMVVRNLSQVGSLGDLQEKITQCGLKWLIVQGIKQTNLKPNFFEFPDWMKNLVESQTQIWVLGSPIPGKETEFLGELNDMVETWGATGAILDIKKIFLNKEEEAYNLATAARQLGIPLGICASGPMVNLVSFPLSAFRELDFGIPQIFDTSKIKYQSCMENWKSVLGTEFIIPMLSSFIEDKQMKADLQEINQEMAVVWWDWITANLNHERWKIIQEFNL